MDAVDYHLFGSVGISYSWCGSIAKGKQLDIKLSDYVFKRNQLALTYSILSPTGRLIGLLSTAPTQGDEELDDFMRLIKAAFEKEKQNGQG